MTKYHRVITSMIHKTRKYIEIIDVITLVIEVYHAGYITQFIKALNTGQSETDRSSDLP